MLSQTAKFHVVGIGSSSVDCTSFGGHDEQDLSSYKPSVPKKSNEQSIAISASVGTGDDTLASKPGLECLDWSTENGIHVVDGNNDPCIHVASGNGDACKEFEIFADEGGQNQGSDEVVIPYEEATFLRMLGCEENAKCEALTEDEIEK
ncbi:hypothetical protein MRB53_000941 [Persea americana]|uniref:Uncharacterized protein n=1 Tax=Persea americana TaxID=3435 RepID=A0ACC2MQL1_PERAE|nr:hypothetical protein MRB53_000941 [Persea americana]